MFDSACHVFDEMAAREKVLNFEFKIFGGCASIKLETLWVLGF